MDRKQLSNEDENGKEGEHVYVKGHSEYGSMFWEYESDDVVILNFSMFLSVCWGEKQALLLLIWRAHCCAECSITYSKTSGQVFEFGSKIFFTLFSL